MQTIAARAINEIYRSVELMVQVVVSVHADDISAQLST